MMNKLRLKSLSMLLLSALMVFSCVISVSANEADDADADVDENEEVFEDYAEEEPLPVDADRHGSITISLIENSNTADVSDGVLQLYQAAAVKVLNGYMYYEYTDEFAECDASIDDLGESYYPDELIEWIEGNGIEPDASIVPDDGVAVFNNLSPGIYLVVQSEASEGYYEILPFVITVPMLEGNEWLYDVNADPKLELIPSEETESEQNGTEQSEDVSEPPVEVNTETERQQENGGNYDVQSYNDNGGNTAGGGTSTNTATPTSTTNTTTAASTPTATQTATQSNTAGDSNTDTSTGTSVSTQDSTDDDSLYKGDSTTVDQVQTGDNTRFIYLGIAAVVVIILIIVGVTLTRSKHKNKDKDKDEEKDKEV